MNQRVSTNTYKNKKVLVLGLGIEGMDLSKFLSSEGADLFISDQKSIHELRDSQEKSKLLAGLPRSRLYLDGVIPKDLQSFDTIFASQGVPDHNPILIQARQANCRISSMLELFLERCQVPVVGITGSAGKTTTTAILADILRYSGESVLVGGNIGFELLSSLPDITNDTKVIVEMSHTQLLRLNRSPAIACITNITPNHLDQFSWKEYQELKSKIIKWQSPTDLFVANIDDQNVRKIIATGGSRTVAISLGEVAHRSVSGTSKNKDESAKPRIEENGTSKSLYGYANYQPTGNVDELYSLQLDIPQGPYGMTSPITLLEDWSPFNQPQAPGYHNMYNVAFAAVISYFLLQSKEPKSPNTILELISSGIKSFQGVEHRLETIESNHRSLLFLNDSIATTPERTLAALTALNLNANQKVVLLMGGRDKKLPFPTKLRDAIADRCRGFVGFGESGAHFIEKGSPKSADPLLYISEKDLTDAFWSALRIAKNGDVILLAPGGTSFDHYANFEKRGREFKALVAGLASDGPKN